MTTLRTVVTSFLVYLVLFSIVDANQFGSVKATGGLSTVQRKHQLRSCLCRLASRQKICLRVCGTCCARCRCVAPGTSGNRDVCPCCPTMTTHGSSLKCP